MNGLLCVLPVMLTETADICINSLQREDSAAGLDRSEILVVDNSRDGWADQRYGMRTHRDPAGHNLGVARSWNLGARQVLDDGLDYLVIMSASMQFGPAMHTTWKAQMETFWGHNVIECDGHSWHLIALHRRLFETIGLFDENFYPGYFEQIDWCYRLRMVGLEQGFVHVWVNALSQGAGLHAPAISLPADPLLDYYAAKWGGPKGEELWRHPYETKPLGYFEDVPIPVLAERYGLEVWW